MKQSIKRIVCLLIIITGVVQVTFAQQKSKRKVNASINIGKSTNDSIRIVHANLGLLTNIYQLKGAGINVISSTVANKVYGIQLSGISNITGKNMTGFQVAGVTNVNGNNTSGLSLSGLVNIIGNNTSGMTFSGGINIVGSHANGFSVGGLLNMVTRETNGLQIGGIANITGERSNGAALSGLLNVTGSNLNGIQISSLLNVVGNHVCGVQLSGLSNVGVKVKGIQLSGVGNIAAEELSGLQLSSLFNTAKSVKGVQASLLNYCTGEIKGLQLGLVNYSKDTSTVKVGLVNLNPRTRIQLLAFGGNTTKINLAVRFLNKTTYTILGTGAQFLGLDEKFSLTTFYRAGLYFPLFKQLDISGDLGFAHIESLQNKKQGNLPARMYSLQARINLEYRPVKRFGIFASGGYAHTRLYNKSKTFENKPIVELGIILF